MADENKREDNSGPPVDKIPDAEPPVVPATPEAEAAAPPTPVTDTDSSKFGTTRAGATPAVFVPELDTSMAPPVVATTTDTAPDAVAPPTPTTTVAPDKGKPATPADGVAAAEVPAGEVPATDGKDKPKDKTTTAADGTPADSQPAETDEVRDARLQAEQAEAIKKAASNKPIEMKPAQTDAEKAAMEAQQQMDASANMATAKYRSIYEKRGYMKKMNGEWGVADVDDELKKALGESGTIEDNKKYGLDFKLPTGQTIEWHRNMGGAEFIGMTRKTATFDMNAAHAVIATSKSRGWPSINLHGTVDQKDMMWLEAQRQGLAVVNHQPALNSEYRKMWDKEAAERMNNTPGASPSSHPTPNPGKGMQNDEETPSEMQPPAQIDTARMEGDKMDGGGKKDMGKFVKADALPNNGEPVEAEMSEKDRQLAFIARKMEQHKDDPEKMQKLQEMKDGFEGKGPVPVLDAETAADIAKEGVKLPAAKTEADAGKGPKATDTPDGNLSLSSYLDRELKNKNNSPEVTQGLQEMKGALDEGRIKEGDIDVAKLKTDAGGVVTRDQYVAIAEGLEAKNPDTMKFSRPAAAVADGEKPAVVVAEVVVGNSTKKTVTAGAPKNA